MAPESSKSVYRQLSLIFSTFQGQRVGQVQPAILFSLLVQNLEPLWNTGIRCIYPRVDCPRLDGVKNILSRKIDAKYTVQLRDLSRGDAPVARVGN